ncbi:hypothetical protein SEMRO_343_G121920.1 [Seminavis robusta]|uniref:Uncharacterized protein n=1 Tax=Seminavis robusta TaxID=568900 RepID=A0A9N8HD31_9STRA|nr:hypothetical protein SEMRO_343_G121920.1 [Seminavis robusta]|eukprot:Sro343_g121920.1 n/a (324) ;mRNA; r:15014-15985
MLRHYNKHIASGGLLNTYPDDPWFAAKGGRPYLDMNEVLGVSTNLSTNQGSSMGYSQIESIITTTRKKRLEDSGISVLRDEVLSPSRNTVTNYGGALSMLSGSSCTSRVIAKTPTRETAENSMRSGMDFASLVGSTLYMPTERELPAVRTFLNDHASDSQKYVYKTISALHEGAPLLPVKKANIASMDDTTEWLVEGLNKENIDKVRFTATSSYTGKGTRSLYRTTKESMATGIRVKLSIVMTADGTTAPLFVSVTGLNERELFNESGVEILEIPGLCIGGGGVTAGNREMGYVAFVRNNGDKMTDRVKHEAFTDRILIPFMN